MATATIEIVGRATGEARPREIAPDVGRNSLPRWAAFFLIFGLYLTLRGYHSFDGDQAYRLPLLLHQQDTSLYATDPFVRAFDVFNPHRGYLALLGWASRPFGLATALAGLFGLTLAATTWAFDRMTLATWPELGRRVGLVAVVLVLACKAGNIGTNHLFESTLLDRLMGFALGWLALASVLEDPRRGAWAGALFLGLATWIHPSVGLQIAMTLVFTWGVWWIWPEVGGVGRARSGLAILALGLAVAPGLLGNADQAGRLFEGLEPEEFRLLAVMIQGPQHMLPSTWRASQWLAWGCYPLLALLALGRVGMGEARETWPAGRIRLATLIGVNLVSLGLAYVAIEVVGDLKVTVFQPFRMATLARGLALVAIAGRVVALWSRGDLTSRGRAVLIGVGLSGDWAMVVASAVELAMTLAEAAVLRGFLPPSRFLSRGVGLAVLTFGLVDLARHDTESGHLAILGGLGALILGTWLARRVRVTWTLRRVGLAVLAAWLVPLAALVTPWFVGDPASHAWSAALVGRCRFAEVPTDDLERLATWCRENTPASSRFIGPPGPKTFRLWSRRPLAFNRAASPYHAAGLADWSRRYRDHVGFEGSTSAFARAYLLDYHKLEAGFGRMTDLELAELARRQGATHILNPAARPSGGPDGPLQRLKVEGRYAVDRVRDPDESRVERNPKKIAEGPFSIRFESLEQLGEGQTTSTSHERTSPSGRLRNLGGRRGQLTLGVGAWGGVL